MKNTKLLKIIVDIFNSLHTNENYFSDNDGIIIDDRIIDFRNSLRKKMNQLNETAKVELDEKTSFYILYPIVVCADECMSNIFKNNTNLWPKLQGEIYNSKDGGERFYELLDNIIEQPIFPGIVYQVFYMCLKDNFKGMLIDENSDKNTGYYIESLEKIMGSNIVKNTAPIITKGKSGFSLLNIICQFFKNNYYLYFFAGAAILYFVGLYFLHF